VSCVDGFCVFIDWPQRNIYMILALKNTEDYEDSRFRNLRGKFTLQQTTKALKGSRCIALLFLNPRLYVGVGGQRHALAALPPGKIRYPLYRRLGGPRGQSGRVRKISPPLGIRSPDRPAHSKSLYRLKYPDPHFTWYRLVNTNRCFEGFVPIIFKF
jgi:hypothetical protein